jgi:ATP-dependent RNA helicase RhlE
VQLLSAIETLTRQTLQRVDERDFEPEHRVPMTDAGGQVLKKPKKPKKPKPSGGRSIQPAPPAPAKGRKRR